MKTIDLLEKEELSLEQLMEKAFRLSIKLCTNPDKTYRNMPKKADDDMVCGWADGLNHKYYYKMSSGQCSLQAMIDFDIEAFEKSVISDIARMEQLLIELKLN